MIRRTLVAAAVMASALSGATPRADGLEPTLRITSPLGRTGLPGTIRIVARLDGLVEPKLTAPQPPRLRFFVDNVLLSSDEDGPPYDALWVDENPFEPRELSVEAELPAGGSLRTSIPKADSSTTSPRAISHYSRMAIPRRSTWCHKAVNRRCSRCWSTAVRA